MKAETVMLIVTVTIVGSEGDLMLSMLRHFTIVMKVVIIIVVMMIQKSLVLHARLRRQVTQCNVFMKTINLLRAEIVELKCRTNVVSPELLEGNPDMLKFYIGLPNWSILTALLTLIAPALPEIRYHRKTKLVSNGCNVPNEN